MKKILIAVVACLLIGKAISWMAPKKATVSITQSGVVLYSAKWCGYCTSARELLKREEIPFAEYDIETSDHGQKMYRALGSGGIPVLEIGKKVVRGYSEQTILAAVKAESIKN
ncbi:MAG: glutaredoxin domain-containing protein [Casimicrobium sp.]